VQHVTGILGTSLLGDGSVVPVLDIAELVREQSVLKQNRKISTSSIKKINCPVILIVDDSLSVRNTLSNLMNDAGYTVVTARDGLDALNQIKQKHPDLILTDMEMPRINGLELATQIKGQSETQNIPIIMITSRTTHKHRELAKKAGVDQYLTKPYSENELMDSMISLLGQSKHQASTQGV
jgi:chemosensory pili system protein ChpA (sensor histidine kinase/response regulator)